MKLLMHSRLGNRSFDSTKNEDVQLLMYLLREELTADPTSSVRITRTEGYEELSHEPVC